MNIKKYIKQRSGISYMQRKLIYIKLLSRGLNELRKFFLTPTWARRWEFTCLYLMNIKGFNATGAKRSKEKVMEVEVREVTLKDSSYRTL